MLSLLRVSVNLVILLHLFMKELPLDKIVRHDCLDGKDYLLYHRPICYSITYQVFFFLNWTKRSHSVVVWALTLKPNTIGFRVLKSIVWACTNEKEGADRQG